MGNTTDFEFHIPVNAASLAGNAIAAENNHFTTELKPLLKQYCYECHSGDDAESGVAFDRFTDSAEVQTDF